MFPSCPWSFSLQEKLPEELLLHWIGLRNGTAGDTFPSRDTFALPTLNPYIPTDFALSHAKVTSTPLCSRLLCSVFGTEAC